MVASLAAPQMERTVDFEKEDFPLYEVRMEKWGGFVWINLNPKAEPLRKYLGDLPEKFDKYSTESLQFFGTIGTYKVEANWKATVENANECYHCPLVHPETIGPHYLEHIPLDNSKIHGPYTILYWENSTKGLPEGYRFESLPENLSGLTEEDKRRLYIVQVFSNTQLYFSPDRVTTFQVWPDGPHRSLITSQMYIQDFVDIDEEKRKAIEESIKWNDFINNQDIPLLEKQQKGLDSGVFEGGRFSALEGPVFGFQRLVSQALSD
jgi:phenylpropionate dioxygenase-like ring-hydroxylating dioxygenase large terminal subunit